MYNVQCTMYNVQCTMYNVHVQWNFVFVSLRLCTVYIVHCTCTCTCTCTLYIVHCTLYIVHCTCTLYIVHSTLYIVHCTCTLYIVHCTLYIVHCTLYIYNIWNTRDLFSRCSTLTQGFGKFSCQGLFQNKPHQLNTKDANSWRIRAVGSLLGVGQNYSPEGDGTGKNPVGGR